MQIEFALSSEQVEVYDFAEVLLTTDEPVGDPFRAAQVTGQLDGTPVAGFCDSADGTLYRIRFLATAPGEHRYTVRLRIGDAEWARSGVFLARPANARGLLGVDEEYPFHFVWRGTGEHCFINGTTAYCMAGLSEELIRSALNRLAQLGINRVRVSLSPPRVADGGAWFEPVKPREGFTFLYGPWVAANPNSVEDPRWDTSRFDVDYWRKFEGLLAHARSLGILVSVIFYTDGARPGSYPFARDLALPSQEELLYYQYAAARLAAYSNVMWDLTNEWHLFRTMDWVEAVGAYLRSCDPYGHPLSVHGCNEFPFRRSAWADFAAYQSWDEHGGYAFMLHNRHKQVETGRRMPQINEEYGYEDHYPRGWGEDRVAPARNAESRRRIAWEIAMAGGYQTTGESAANGLGGWLNGLGDDSMTMLQGYRHMAAFFESIPWWTLEPMPELAGGNMCLAHPGQRYVVYLPEGGRLQLSLPAGHFRANWYNPRTGEATQSKPGAGPGVLTIRAPDRKDWMLHVWRDRLG